MPQSIRAVAEHRHQGHPSRAQHVRELADLFGLLGDPTRLQLLIELVDGEEVCVSELSVRVGVADSAVSHALRLLRAHGVVRGRRDGNRVFYSLVDEHVRLLVEASSRHLNEVH